MAYQCHNSKPYTSNYFQNSPNMKVLAIQHLPELHIPQNQAPHLLALHEAEPGGDKAGPWGSSA